MRDRSNSRGPKKGRPQPNKGKGKGKGESTDRPASAKGTRGGARDVKPRRKASDDRPSRPAREEGDKPASKRAGRRPPKALRSPGESSSEGRSARPERGWRERDMHTKRHVGRGPDRASKRGKCWRTTRLLSR